MESSTKTNYPEYYGRLYVEKKVVSEELKALLLRQGSAIKVNINFDKSTN